METLGKTDSYSLVYKGIMKVLLYSDVFQYPLTKEEIAQRHPLKEVSIKELEKGLAELVEKQVVFQIKDFYTLQNNSENIERRLKANLLAQKYLKISKRIVNVIKYFPFVRGIFLSGSISKNYIDENSDIDYFVITKANYLWVTRTLFVLFRRIGLLGSRKLFCFNYMIDEEHLKTEHQSIYIATEIVTLIPMYQDGIHQQFLEANTWIEEYYPNYPIQKVSSTSKNWFKSLLESTLQTIGVKKLNNRLMHQTKKRKIKLFGEHIFSDSIKLSNFQSYIAKDNMKPHYRAITEKYEEKIQSFEDKMQISLL
jgi:hypothetical protein